VTSSHCVLLLHVTIPKRCTVSFYYLRRFLKKFLSGNISLYPDFFIITWGELLVLLSDFSLPRLQFLVDLDHFSSFKGLSHKPQSSIFHLLLQGYNLLVSSLSACQ
jgi:hypothetical protein